MRSATAHTIYQDDARFEVRCAGTDASAATVLAEELLSWADSIVVMEQHHRNHIRRHYPAIYKTRKIVCLYIPDEYDYLDIHLIPLLRAKVEDVSYWRMEAFQVDNSSICLRYGVGYYCIEVGDSCDQ